MSLQILFAAPDRDWQAYQTTLPAALAAEGIAAHIALDVPPEQADYVVYAPGGGPLAFDALTNARGVLSLWAGVEKIVGAVPSHLPLTRMVDEGLQEGMRDWVCGHVLRHHLGLDSHVVNPDHHWQAEPAPLARDRKVGVLGLGALGSHCAQALAGLGFDVAGWSRSPKQLPGIACFSQNDGLKDILRRSDILVLLLPHTAQTENLMNAQRFALLKQGAVLLNPGRGALIDDTALLQALDGPLAHATLDVFRTEPLPRDHPFWAHPKITVTPHVAAATRPASASRAIARNIARDQSGQSMLHLVDRTAGY